MIQFQSARADFLGSLKYMILFSHRKCFFQSFLDYEPVVKMSDEFNGADLRNVCTEAGKLCLYF